MALLTFAVELLRHYITLKQPMPLLSFTEVPEKLCIHPAVPVMPLLFLEPDIRALHRVEEGSRQRPQPPRPVFLTSMPFCALIV